MPYGSDMNLGAPELLIALVILLVLFGGSQLPKLARALGQARREFHTAADSPTHHRSDRTPSGSPPAEHAEGGPPATGSTIIDP